MPQSRSEQITANFYEWEERGRGWQVYDAAVELEPIFIPFSPVRFNGSNKVDEGFRPSMFTKATTYIKKAFTVSNSNQSEDFSEDADGLLAYLYTSEAPLQSFSISFPKDARPFKAYDIEKFLTMLSYTNSTVCFEIVAWSDLIRLQFVCRQSDTSHIENQVRAYFPSCIIQNGTTYINNIVDGEKHFSIVDFGLEEEYMRPIASADKFDTDPLTGLYGVLDHLEGGEQAVIQVLFKGTVNPWAQSIMSSVSDGKGESMFSDAPEMPKLAQEKISAPLFSVSIRVIAQDTSYEGACRTIAKIGRVLTQSSQSIGNKLIPLNNNGYSDQNHLYDVLLRQTHRGGMLLNAKELATFVHYPISVSAKKLETDIRKTKRAPNIAWGYDFCLGSNQHQGFEGIVTLSPEQRLKHMHVIGATGTGKSTLLQSCIVQDILLGNGLAVLDPHGDLIESILPHIPENRYDDVLLIDPSDAEYPVGFNILSAHSDLEKEILASDLVAVFKRLSTSFGDQMYSVLANAILAFVESTEGGTLIDLRRFLIEKPYREQFLKTVSDPSVVYYWQKEYPLLKSSSIGSILTRLDSFLRPKLIRNMVAQKKSIDFESIMDGKKILLIKLSQGLIGTENSYLLGTFFVSKIYQAAMARQAKSKENRNNFFLYIDEFQNFITSSTSAILSGTRKYGLGCILAHQDMSQLQKYDTELANSVVANAGTRICFRVGDLDAKRFAEGFSSFDPQDIQNLGVGQAVARIERPEYDFTMSTLQLKSVDPSIALETARKVIDYSRERYGTAKNEIEKSLEYLRDEKQVVQKEVAEEEMPEIVSGTPGSEPKEEVSIPEIQEPVKAIEITDSKTKQKLIEKQELTEHRYTQMYIKKMAEARGYTAKLEQPTKDGGRVDVLLEKNANRIACEIGVTTTTKWETHNIQKCLDEGYELVVALTNKTRLVSSLQKEIQAQIPPQWHDRIMVADLPTFLSFLDKENAKDASVETRIKGYRVKLEYSAISEQENKSKSETITKLIVDSFKKQNQTPYTDAPFT
ncbi:MAG: type IV secretion system DNA-binding domain-containing protein [Bacteroidetes bacterium]|nr:type IV secretion system DNA-binding domain-containing protein [Bacteroidota bacterium]